MVKKAPKKVPETYRKIQDRKQASKAQMEKQQEKRQEILNQLSQQAHQKAESYLQQYLAQDEEAIRNRQQAKQKGNYWVPGEPKVILAIRIRGINHVPPKPRKILQLFRLIQLHSAVFIKNNKATRNMLRSIQPYITYGYPNWQTVSKLVYKRGYGRVNKQRIPITDNLVIDQNLGSLGIRTCEDLIHQLYSCGPHFKQANSFLWRFKLTSPRKGFSSKKRSFIQGGDWGNREEKINALVLRML